VIRGDAQAQLRAMLAATNLVDTALLRYVMKVPPPATLPARRRGPYDRADGDEVSDR
jgi:hypothetical protein